GRDSTGRQIFMKIQQMFFENFEIRSLREIIGIIIKIPEPLIAIPPEGVTNRLHAQELNFIGPRGQRPRLSRFVSAFREVVRHPDFLTGGVQANDGKMVVRNISEWIWAFCEAGLQSGREQR
ncbi:MAG: hypothetical protein JWM99_3241, partial [Verrucomicrobiales bacterium]|nr:hypothetical protein [Verrucomicrobiales bacterium]